MNLKYLPLLFVLLLLGPGCNLEELNVNPNDPTDVPLETLLPPAEKALMDFLAGDAAGISGIFSNYFQGIENRFLPVETYAVDRDFLMRPIWEDLYVDALTTLSLIIQKSEDDSPHYAGIGRILMAIAMSTASDVWGDLPYKEAFRGPGVLAPDFQRQDEIYVLMISGINTAITELEKPESLFTPGNDDLFFGGDVSAWKKVAYSLRARLSMRQVYRDNALLGDILPLINKGIQSRDEALVYNYNEQEFNPWYQFQTSTPYLQIDDDFADLLDNDPRESALIKSSFGEKLIGPYIASDNAPVYLITYEEMHFLEAEYYWRSNMIPEAETSLRLAVAEHISRVTEGLADPMEVQDYLDSNCIVISGQAGLSTIMNQKYIANFPSIEGWTDFRRTGFPNLTPNPGGSSVDNPNGEIPLRFPYPLNEVLYNPNVPTPQPDLQTPVWWDID